MSAAQQSGGLGHSTPTRQLSKFLRPERRDRPRSSSGGDPGGSVTDNPARSSSSSAKMIGKKSSRLFSRTKEMEPVGPQSAVTNHTGNSISGTRTEAAGAINDPPVIIEPPSNSKPRSRPPRPSSASDTNHSNANGPSGSAASNVGSVRNLGDFSSRLSGWFNNTFTGSSSDLPQLLAQASLSASSTRGQGQLSNSTSMGGSASSTSPAKKVSHPLVMVAKHGKDHLDKAMRYLLDSDAQPDKSTDKIWLLGVEHPGYEPPPPPSSTPASFTNSGYTSTPPPSTNLTVKRGHRRDSTDGRNKSSPAFRNPLPSSHSNSSTQSLNSAVSTSSTVAPGSKEAKNALQWPVDFYADYTSRIWLTYRNSFPPIRDSSLSSLEPPVSCSLSASIPSSSAPNEMAPLPSPSKPRWPWQGEKVWTSDAGWGCMLRTGQSLLANALIHLHLSRDWRRPPQPSLSPEFTTYVKILTWFLDTPSPYSPFGVHRMALAGKELGKEVGSWFGPSTAAGAIRRLIGEFGEAGLEVAVGVDGVVYQSDVYAASNTKRGTDGSITSFLDRSKEPGLGKHHKKAKESLKWGNRPVLVLVGIRLGIDGVNPIYYNSLKALFTFPQFIGIAGGRPSSSYYFVGAQGDSLYYLDPHHTRPAVPLRVPPSNLASMSFDEASLLGIDDGSSQVGSSQASQASSKLGRRRGSEIFMQGHVSTPETSESERKSTRRLSIRRASLNRTSTSYQSPTSPASVHSNSSSHAQQSSVPLSSSPLARSSLSTPPQSSVSPPRARSSTAISSMVAVVPSSSPPANGFPQSPISPSSSTSATPIPLSISSPATTPFSPSSTTDSHNPLLASTATIDPMSAYLATAYSMAELKTFHCDRVRKMPISHMDPSMLLGFLCRDEADWKDLRERVADMAKTKKAIFAMQDEPPTWPDEENESLDLESASDDMEEDEFESPIGVDDDEEEDGIEVKRRQTIEAKREEVRVAPEADSSKEDTESSTPFKKDAEDEDDEDTDEDEDEDAENLNLVTPVGSSGKPVSGRHDTIIGRVRPEVAVAAAAAKAATDKALSSAHDRNDSQSTAASSSAQSHDGKDSRGNEGDNDEDDDDEDDDDDDDEWVDPIKPTPAVLPSGSRHTKVISVDSNGPTERTVRSRNKEDDALPTPTATPAPTSSTHHVSRHQKTSSMTRELPAIPTTVVSMSREPRSRDSGSHSRESSRPSSSSTRLSQIALSDAQVPFPTRTSEHRKQSSASSRSATSISAGSTPVSPGSSPVTQYTSPSSQHAKHAYHSSHSSQSHSSYIYPHSHSHHRSGAERDAMSYPFPGGTTDESGATSSDSGPSSDAWAGDEKVVAGTRGSLVPKRERRTTVGRTAPMPIPMVSPQQQQYAERMTMKAKHGGRTTSGGVRAVWKDEDGDDF